MEDHALLEWYRPRRVLYPWRRGRSDPYRVLVSEVMLQQTQASRVVRVYRRFLRRFPRLKTLGVAPRSEVLRVWSGLGYNRRAVRLSEAARAMVLDHGGRVPRDVETLQRLPGIGPYTAAAVASIAFGVPVPAIDTNVARVVARAALGVDPGHASASDIRRAATEWLDRSDPGAWNQALMDLGREVCRPVPRCDACPLAVTCRLRRSGGIRPSAPRHRQTPFEGSSRQVRGIVVRTLLDRPGMSLNTLRHAIGKPEDALLSAVRSLVADGLVRASPFALAGHPRGLVRLA